MNVRKISVSAGQHPFITRLIRSAALLGCLAGVFSCSSSPAGNNLDGGPQDAVAADRSPDLRAKDLSFPPDAVIRPDLRVVDLAPWPDLAPPADLSRPADAAVIPDLAQPLDASRPDLSRPDLSAPTDLSRPNDLAVPRDLNHVPDLAEIPDLSSPPDLADWQCQFPGQEPNCYLDHNFTDLIDTTPDFHLLVGLDYNIPPLLATNRLRGVFRTNQDWQQFDIKITGNSGRTCQEVYVYQLSNSSPLYVQGFADPNPNFSFEAGPYTVAVPPPSAIPPVCQKANTALEAFQLAMADPYFVHYPVTDMSGQRLVFPQNGAYSGVTFKEGLVTLADLQTFQAVTGVHPAIIAVFTDYVNGFPRDSVDNIIAFGSVPLVKFMPLDWARPGVDAYPMEKTVRGDYDQMLNKFIDGVLLTAGPVLVAWGHEVNNLAGYVYARSAQVATPSHVHFLDLAQAKNAGNFNAIINLNNWPWADFKNYIFRHPLVAATAFDGYNMGAVGGGCWSNAWQTFDEVNRRAFLEAKCYYPEMTFIMGEFATSDVGGNRAAWYCDAFTRMKQYPLGGFVLFSIAKNEDGCGFINWDIRK